MADIERVGSNMNIERDVEDAVRRAINQQLTITIDYLARSTGELLTRNVDPEEIKQPYSGRLCIVGWDHLRDEWRSFRIDRVRGISVTDQHFERRG